MRVLIGDGCRAPDATAAPPSHGLARVAQHVEEHLAELGLIGQDVGQAGIEPELQPNSARTQFGPDHRDDLLNDAVDVERHQARLRRCAEREQILDQRAMRRFTSRVDHTRCTR